MSPPANSPVFVIVLNWNGKDDTLECLSSLRKAGVPGSHTLVVDNGSTDGSVGAIRSRFPDSTILEMKQNLRFAGGNNRGIAFALGNGAEFVLLLNNDTVVDEGFLGPLVERMRADNSIGMVAPKICYHAPPGRIWFAGARISYWLGTMAHIGIREEDHGQYDTARETDYATGCCVLVRRELIESAGMLDEAFFMYTEDADWSVRARKKGFRIFYEPRSRIHHKVSVSAGGNLSWFKLRNKYVSQMKFFARHASWYHWLVFPWMSILVNLTLLFSRILNRRNDTNHTKTATGKSAHDKE
jgi:GT2 family glycosyltransferase